MSADPGLETQYDRSDDLAPMPVRFASFFQGPPVGFAMAPAAVDAGLHSLQGITPADTMSASVQVLGGAIRYTFDGTPPTAGVGHRADVNTTLTLTGRRTVQGFQWIAEAVAAQVAVTFWA